ncbi:MAG: hypothetical protein ACODAG_01855 [Myxococcota bacterium]
MSNLEVDDELLARALGWVYVLVSTADGRMDRKETRRFMQLLDRDDAFESAWMKRAMEQAKVQSKMVIDGMASDPDACLPELERLGTAADEQLPADEARAFKHDLLAFGKAIARASGGVLGVGSKIAGSEAETLGRLATLLRYEP